MASSKIGPDYLIKRRVKINDRLHDAEAYKREIVKQHGVTSWFESKMKYDFQDNKKREDEAMKTEISQANLELTRTRNHRLQLLYEHENRVYEAELRELGLAVIRQLY